MDVRARGRHSWEVWDTSWGGSRMGGRCSQFHQILSVLGCKEQNGALKSALAKIWTSEQDSTTISAFLRKEAAVSRSLWGGPAQDLLAPKAICQKLPSNYVPMMLPIVQSSSFTFSFSPHFLFPFARLPFPILEVEGGRGVTEANREDNLLPEVTVSFGLIDGPALPVGDKIAAKLTNLWAHWSSCTRQAHQTQISFFTLKGSIKRVIYHDQGKMSLIGMTEGTGYASER